MIRFARYDLTALGTGGIRILAKGSPMSAQIEELWHRLKAAAQECAAQGRHLNERSAQYLVFQIAREVRFHEKMPPEVLKFYVSEVLAFTREFSRNEAQRA